ncbi:MAG: hypothetical protein EA419_08800 [Wenzhouxiangella sp.]|nr:MAG: hypothetical protein EA419_08800 [Wenzhouxiangella sp.]
MRKLLMTALLISIAIPSAYAAWQVEGPVLDRGVGLSIAATDAWHISFDSDLLADDVDALPIALPGRTVQWAERERLLFRSPDDQTWVGRVAADGTRVVLTMRRGWLAGKIFGPGQSWEIRPSAEYGTVLIALDDARFPECSGAEVPDRDFRRSETRPVASAPDTSSREAPLDFGSDTVRIDTLIAYTPASTVHLGGHDQAQAFLQLGVDLTNLSFINSEVDVAFRTVHFAEVNAQESDNCTGASGDLVAARNSTTLQNLRSQHQADLVALITMGGYCGCAYVQRNPGPGFYNFGYQATSVGCAVGNLTLAHEYGHNLGMEHNPENGANPSGASYPYAFGHYVSGEFRTVMSYANPCTDGCPRQPHFSNPDVDFSGMATGIPDQRNNAEVARLISPIVRDFEQPDDEPMPEPAVSPGQIQIETEPGQSGTVQFTLFNQGSGSFSYLIQDTVAGSSDLRDVHSPHLDETFLFPEMTIPGRSDSGDLRWQSYLRVGGFQTRGDVVGISFEGTVDLDAGVLASDLYMVVARPDGEQYWYGTSRPWSFDGASADGHYATAFVDSMASEPAEDEGLWRIWLSGGHNETEAVMNWSNVAVTLHKTPLPPGCDTPSSVGWISSISPGSGNLSTSGSQNITIGFDSTGLSDDSIYQATLCLTIDDPRVAMIEIPVILHTGETNPVFRDRFEQD